MPITADPSRWPVWPPCDPAIERSIQEAWRSGQWGRYHSDLAAELTRIIQDRYDVSHVRLCCSGTMAVESALRGVGVGRGDEVVVAAYDYPGNLRCIELLEATPVLVDVECNGVTICPASLRQLDRPGIKAVLFSHLYGQLADVQSLRQICQDRGWMMIEDACQVPGAGWIEGDAFRPVGTYSDVATLSFGGSKPLTCGSGGAVVTRDDRIAARIRSYAERPSDTFGLSPLQCAALIPQWPTLATMDDHRRESVRRLIQLDWQSIGVRIVQQNWTDLRTSYYKLAMAVSDPIQRADLRHQMSAIGITLGEGYRSSHRMSQRRVHKPLSLANAATLADQIVLMDHRYLLAEEVAERVGQFVRGHS
ncbi:DegT/DnrJ/EryC1/StrS family aminotransferase [Neorhodopirellula pilleata]|uniref:L-glutamine:2-deoxy-scyllo-inosose aminotransferase n=1 Tax=Neorhodopirellula pilleata TaxID=2714738 RepID=A0A5C6A626_9BACT|nr:DegT/DnrJ/EryC1/StrS family aminotransferase [Neorhodopirellula pilleata]TWT94959.1 L-glutamine:2-deoxy-scyllo-inosose aminotransferase [Neorhodopirellula pilleata]